MTQIRSRKHVVAVVYGVKVSEDHGKTWRARALCDECYRSIEPPNMANKEIQAGSYSCDWCGCRNSMYSENKFNRF